MIATIYLMISGVISLFREGGTDAGVLGFLALPVISGLLIAIKVLFFS